MSTISALVRKVKESEGFSPLWLLLGPVFLLASTALAIYSEHPELVISAVFGLFLSARLRMRGFFYGIALLLISFAANAFFHPVPFLWLFGLASSEALGFFITVLTFEESDRFVESLDSQIHTRSQAIRNLEEDLEKAKLDAQEQMIGLQEKVSFTQKELEEAQTETSSLFLLNDVLRKTAARETKEREFLERALMDRDSQMNVYLAQLQELKSRLEAKVDPTDASLKERNLTLLNELNAARFDREQTRLINETLVHMHAKESTKKALLERELRKAQEIISSLEKEMQDLRLEKNSMSQQLEALDKEQAEQRERVLTDPTASLLLEEKVRALAHAQDLYRQLRTQFDEKNRVLMDTRAELFRIETELETLQREKEQMTPDEEEQEFFTRIDQELADLEEENKELQEIIAKVMEQKPSDSSSREEDDQQLLF